MSDTIYTVSDLDRKRRQVTNTARRGLARIRDTDGTGLVLLPARHYEVLEAVSLWADRLRVVERARTKSPHPPAPSDFGDLTWLRHLDEDDLAEFVADLRDAISLAYHDDDLAPLHETVRDWRATADELADPDRREMLLGAFEPEDFVGVSRPEHP
ncbi:MAG: hypothetical protein GEU81_11790 [Nitriliruptorales bacterium]|nr:hypothetical protein [Nitriliruptorales bacterium]